MNTDKTKTVTEPAEAQSSAETVQNAVSLLNSMGIVVHALDEIKSIGSIEKLKALAERDKPKRIITARFRNEDEPFSQGDYVIYRCPGCHAELGYAFHYPPNEHMYVYKFCTTCGQRLLWKWD